MPKKTPKKYDKFGKAVLHKLIDLDMDNDDLAKQLGISGAYVTDILKGTRIATKQKERIVVMLGLDENILQA